MNNLHLSLLKIYFALYISAIIIGIIFISKTLNKYNQRIAIMKRVGSYTEWAKENRMLLFFAKLFDYAAVFCLTGFIFLSIAKTSNDISILIGLLFPFLFISIALHLILYLRLPKNQN